jgi:hypothetical protein
MEDKNKVLFSKKVSSGKGTYFFEVRESSLGERYLLISQSHKDIKGEFKIERVIVFLDHFLDFHSGFKSAVDFFMGIDKKEEVNVPSKLADLRKKHPNAYRSWDKDQDDRLEKLYKDGKSIEEIANDLKRSYTSIESRLVKLGLYKT